MDQHVVDSDPRVKTPIQRHVAIDLRDIRLRADAQRPSARRRDPDGRDAPPSSMCRLGMPIVARGERDAAVT
jgi:hypothetical protein